MNRPASHPAPAAAAAPRRWQRRLADVAVVLVVLAAVHWWQTRDLPAGPAPDFEADFADGSRGSFAAWRARHPGQATALYFWAPWCPVCSAQQGSVDALQADWPVLTVAMQSGDPQAVARSLRERGLAWATAVDPDGRIAALYGVKGVPALVIVAADGRIRGASVGYTTEAGMRLRLWWARFGT
jgi:thiol-disulfide isomerase/thioredoxin